MRALTGRGETGLPPRIPHLPGRLAASVLGTLALVFGAASVARLQVDYAQNSQYPD